MDQKRIIDQTEKFVRESLKNSEGGHDWWHTQRVWKLSKYIAKNEDVNLFVIELAALLHDIADSKFYNGNEKIGPRRARVYLESIAVSEEVISHVVKIVEHISFHKGINPPEFHSTELCVVRDADRLDAIGAIGIARAFNYGGFKNRTLYDPSIDPKKYKNKEDYKNNTAPTINHFYEKLLLLKDTMTTKKGKKIARKRHKFLKKFLKEFYREWNMIF
ncbi:MAG: HD domain-containing protein [Bacteroidales bacterium]|nr:HD domain-containing protein [Bacteroidales bacterium]